MGYNIYHPFGEDIVVCQCAKGTEITSLCLVTGNKQLDGGGVADLSFVLVR